MRLTLSPVLGSIRVAERSYSASSQLRGNDTPKYLLYSSSLVEAAGPPHRRLPKTKKKTWPGKPDESFILCLPTRPLPPPFLSLSVSGRLCSNATVFFNGYIVHEK